MWTIKEILLFNLRPYAYYWPWSSIVLTTLTCIWFFLLIALLFVFLNDSLSSWYSAYMQYIVTIIKMENRCSTNLPLLMMTTIKIWILKILNLIPLNSFSPIFMFLPSWQWQKGDLIIVNTMDMHMIWNNHKYSQYLTFAYITSKRSFYIHKTS